MSRSLTAEYQLLAKAQSFSKGEIKVDSPKTARLLTKICKNPELWLLTYSRFKDSTWASEVFLFDLSEPEQEHLKNLLCSMGILGIKLKSPEGYKALAVNGLKDYLNGVREDFHLKKVELEGELKAVVRFAPEGIVVSGYKRGLPFTTYVGEHDFFHKLYIDRRGRFESVKRISESSLDQRDDLRAGIIKVERSLGKLRELWGLWFRTEKMKKRLENLERFSDASGALL